jgi:NAD(P)-dependent dehydrogenase (short-subunit alcohol dehydrogenase family)
MARALVTGGGSGIGRATVHELARRGHEIVALDLDAASLADLPAAGRVVADITDEATVARAVAELGPVEILVNNAGVSLWGPVEDTPLLEQRRLFDVLYFGPLHLIKAVLPQMRERRSGAIVNVTSVAARAPHPMTAGYSAAKAALDILTEGLAYEVAHFGIRVLSVAPGRVRTNIGATRRRFGSDAYAELVAQVDRGAAAQTAEFGNAPEVVARVIADALADGSARVRYPGTPDAAEWWLARAARDDEGYRRHVWDSYGLDW